MKPSSAATLAVIEEGLLGLDEPVDRLLPELADRRVLVRPAAFEDGAAGLVSTVDDLYAFACMLTRGGAPVLSAECARAMRTDQLTDEVKARGALEPDFFRGRSWSFCQAVYAGGAFGWDGGFGSSWLVDPGYDLTVIVLTQRAFESSALPRVHREIQAAAYAALG